MHDGGKTDEGKGGGWTYQLVGSPCVADRPARSYPLAGPPDCTLLLGSLKDQEENLIVVKTWTWKRKGGRRRENTPDNQQLSQLQPKHTVRHCAHVCGQHWLTRGMQTCIQWVLMHASTHTHTQTLVRTRSQCHSKPRSQETHCSLTERRKHAVWQDGKNLCHGRQFIQTQLSNILLNP